MFPPNAATRRAVTYQVVGLSQRDEILLKSFLRLLAHRTRHDWRQADGSPDVWIAAPCADLSGYDARRTLVIGATHRGERHFVRLPFHASELEQALDTVGGNVDAQVADATATRSSGAVMLHRWPPARLLTSADRLRMASLLTGRAVTLDQLQQRCGCDLATCTLFLAELARAGLLSMQAPAVAPAAAPTVRPNVEGGLLDRIRRRLARVTVAGA